MRAELLFLNNKDMEKLGVNDMKAAIHDVKRAYILTEEGDVNIPGKCVLRWGNTPEELERLVEAVLSGAVRYCPHGRPVSAVLTKKELDKLFRRIV